MIGPLARKLKSQSGDSHSRELLSGSAAAFVLKFISVALSYAMTIFITRTYGPEVMGTYSYVQSVIFILGITASMGFDSSMVRFTASLVASRQFSALRHAYTHALFLLVPTALVLAILLPQAASLFPSLKLPVNDAWPASVALVAFIVSQLNAGCLRGLKQIVTFVFLQDFGVVALSFASLFVLSFFMIPANAPLVAYSIALSVICILGVFFWKRRLNKLGHGEPGGSIPFPELVTTSASMLVASALLFLSGWINVFIIGLLADPVETALFSVAFKVASIVNFALYAINAIATPKFAELYQAGDPIRMRRFARQATRLMLAAGAPCLAVLACFPSFFMKLFGPEFIPAAPVLLILCAGQLANVFCGSVGAILMMTGKQRLFQNILLIGTAVNVALNLTLIPLFGATGAAIGCSVGLAVWNTLGVITVKRVHGFSTLAF
ncbi:flippase [Desulfovibrio inopinatus]|uniref:flippase n=1 Tax=Desulfovibrio inopinatus TaxID=102109 RepID=UPI0003F86C62|nr:flippase [Desulfovibrio inopinatus]